MYIKYLKLINFRNYRELNIKFDKGINVFTGGNAQGKTNLLESIYYCSIGRSPRTNKDKELINWQGKEAYIKAYIEKKQLDKSIEIKIFKEGKKGININSIKVNKLSQLMGVFNVVMFSPEDLKIVKESPIYRRKFLDIELCKFSKKYYYNLVQYNKVLNERNALLKKWINHNYDIIKIYDKQLSKYGGFIVEMRNKYIKRLSEKGKIIHNDITSGTENIEFRYVTQLEDVNKPENSLFELLNVNRKRDMERGTTLCGPHRDDLITNINGINVRNFGSQGQQKTSVLTMKFASLEIIKEIIGEYPVLLLDDVLSELDSNRQNYILNSINKIQTFITCTGIDDIKKNSQSKADLFVVKNGKITMI
ncbi:DNA replication/repair protein RecF [Clostridium sp. MT-14]|uniref:DNA replication and repair protein RecF n=1 Tax=Clostridium aromativorans TaxID=2836848 RepID=A0ABS8N611_9CLOT|nr:MULTISPECIES: DNA replication/repair protein RecF [Clostridium]KAA8665250.1 DNA replication/repair protein RecF [Clostridium sp. HV4-5-A1G]MCC9295234.1 DNA replication/repair protein RecF [Clostridium aromativorans]CAB1255615.1 RecA filament-DNA complex stabilisation, ssDNA and dsDNA binding, ATP binding [Clostridiaceae bacterium BL-3]